jgi:CubicO group peptidase (beta-lactamase class C family)
MDKDSDFIEELRRFVSAELESRCHPGSSVSVVKGDRVVWAEGFGMAHIDEKIPAKPETVYGCASVTKPVVTVGFLQLMEKGMFDLGDPVNGHLDLKIRTDFEEQPTIRDFLTHYTGMPTRVPPLYLDRREAPTLREYIEGAARTVQPPRKSWAYCNTGFAIVGHLMELFTGSPYDEYLVEKVLKPLEINSSAFDLTPAIEGAMAQGYKRAGGQGEPPIPVGRYILGTIPQDPAGSLYSTVMDLANFVIMNMNGGVFKGRRILGEETIDEMHRLQASPGSSRSGMALTWFRNIHDGRVMLSHTGGLPDFTNHVAFYPDIEIGVCWLSNLQDGSGWRPPAPTALRIVAGESPRFDPGSIQTVPDNWRSIVGVYGDQARKSTIRFVNGYLLLDDSLILEKLDEERYVIHGPRNDGYELTFEFGEDGMAKQYDLGNAAIPRYVEEEPQIDGSAVLIGSWLGEYVDSSGFNKMELKIESPTQATVTDKKENNIPLDDFKAEDGRVEGSCTFAIPEEYARWGTRDEVEVKLGLAAVDDRLKGLIHFGGVALPLDFDRE